LEGGMLLDKAPERIKGKDLRETLEISISPEVNAIDLYIKMELKVGMGDFTLAVLAIHELRALFLGQCFAALYRLTYPR